MIGPLRDWKIGITGPPYNSNYWIRKKEGEKPFEFWCHEKLLGKGGFGEVWRAVCRQGEENHGQVRAVKKISKKQAGFLKASQREVQALTTFSKKKACFLPFKLPFQKIKSSHMCGADMAI